MKTLFVGGSKHGQWGDIPSNTFAWKVLAPATTWTPDGDSGVLPDPTETYWIDKVPIEINDLRCVVRTAVWTGLPRGIDKTRAVVSAIFQRDIAEMFSERSWDEWVSTTE